MKNITLFSRKAIAVFFIFVLQTVFGQNNNGDYRTNPDYTPYPANWTTVAIWQVKQNGSWVTATEIPGNTPGSYAVTISDGTTVNINVASEYTIGDLFVEGTLDLKANFTLLNYGSATIKTIGVNDGRVIVGNFVEFRLPSATVFSMEISDAILYGIHGYIPPDGNKEECNANTAIMIWNNAKNDYDRYTTCVGRPGTSGMNFAEFNSTNAGLSVSADGGFSRLFCNAGQSTTLTADLYVNNNKQTTGVTYEWLYFPPGSSVSQTPSPGSTTNTIVTATNLSDGEHFYRLIFTFVKDGKTVKRYADFVVYINFPTVWNGSSWSYGPPSNLLKMKAVINANYDTTTWPSFEACSCEVKPGATLTISEDKYVALQNELNVNEGGNVIIKNNGNLVQKNKDAVNAGSINVRRTYDLTTGRKEFMFLSSAVEGQNMKSIFGNNTNNVPAVQVYNESTNYFSNASLSDYNVKGKGFSVREPLVSYTGFTGGIANNESQVTGKPNNGDINLSLVKTFTGGGYHLVGNPYPSNIDLVELYKHSTNISPTFRFWDNKVNDIYIQMGAAYQGYSYAIFNAAFNIGIAAPGRGGAGDPTGTTVPGRILKIGQGFIVRAQNGGGTLRFDNTIRKTSNAGSVFFGKQKPLDSFKLEFETPSQLVLQNAVAYANEGTNAFGVEDSELPVPGASDALFSLVATGEKLVINGRNSFSDSDRISMGFKAFEPGNYLIRITEKSGIFADKQEIYLLDKVLNKLFDVSTKGYTFYSKSGEFTNRFEILYKNAKILLDKNSVENQVNIYKEAEQVRINSEKNQIKQVEVFDASGRLVFTKNSESNMVSISANRFEQGFYLIKIKLINDEIIIKKFRN